MSEEYFILLDLVTWYRDMSIPVLVKDPPHRGDQDNLTGTVVKSRRYCTNETPMVGGKTNDDGGSAAHWQAQWAIHVPRLWSRRR